MGLVVPTSTRFAAGANPTGTSYNSPPSAYRFGSDSLIVETAVMTPASPAVVKTVDSYLYRLSIEDGFVDAVEEYALEPFELMASSIERTFVDKIFALCDYYLAGPIPPCQSRHIYDLCKLSPVVSFDEELVALFDTVRKQRKVAHGCRSAQDGVNIPSVLDVLIKEESYCDDYENITAPLLFEEVTYEEAVAHLMAIAEFVRK